MSEPAAIERVILWGFMASGKSAVGVALSARLGWTHVDVDTEIERRAARSIARIFAEDGEPFFRRLEVEVTRAVIGRSQVVVSCGGGWITNPESIALIPPDSLTVWLKVTPERALARATAQGGAERRPLLAGDDPGGTVRRLMEERAPLYGRADLTVDTDEGDPTTVAGEIEARIRPRVEAGAKSSPKKDNGEG